MSSWLHTFVVNQRTSRMILTAVFSILTHQTQKEWTDSIVENRSWATFFVRTLVEWSDQVNPNYQLHLIQSFPRAGLVILSQIQFISSFTWSLLAVSQLYLINGGWIHCEFLIQGTTVKNISLVNQDPLVRSCLSGPSTVDLVWKNLEGYPCAHFALQFSFKLLCL